MQCGIVQNYKILKQAQAHSVQTSGEKAVCSKQKLRRCSDPCLSFRHLKERELLLYRTGLQRNLEWRTRTLHFHVH